MQKASCLAEGILADCHSTRALLDAVRFRKSGREKELFSSPPWNLGGDELDCHMQIKQNAPQSKP